MTQRERQTPDGANGPAAVPPVPAAAAPAHSAWESFFNCSPPALRDEFLARAGPRGVLYAHLLPDSAVSAPDPAGAVATFLNGRPRDLPAVRPPAIEPRDNALDAEQREAVARAVHTPDLCLIAGVPGSGKSRVVTEILAQAVGRGERVLFLGPGAAALDHVLVALARSLSVCAVRCVGPDESPEQLPAAVRALTMAARVQRFRDETVPQARAAAVAARQLVAERRASDLAWNRLESLAKSLAGLNARLADLEAKTVALPEQVIATVAARAGLAGPSNGELDAARRERDEALARLDARDAALRAEQEKIGAALGAVATDEAKLRPLAEARLGFRFWSAAWWRARGQGKLHDELEQLQSRRSAIEADAAFRASEADVLARERAGVEAIFAAAVRRFADTETARCLGELACLRSEAAAEAARHTIEWDLVAAELDPASRPTSTSLPEVAELRAAQRASLAAAEEALIAAERWAASVEQAAPDIVAQITSSAEVVAATTGAIAQDAYFGDAATRFDVLVLEEADRITESEFIRAARRAGRWVLVGETAPDGSHGGAGRTLRPAALRPGFFERIWQHLHEDPSRLAYSWQISGDGCVCCQLRPMTPDERTRLETERLADRPDVELRILSHPRGTPELAEVLFPPAVRACEAKAYLFAELGELPVCSRGHGLRWSEESNRILLWIQPAEDSTLESVELAAGVSELFGAAPAPAPDGSRPLLTYALAFDRSAGWTRERAEEWTARHAHLSDSGRTAFLGTPHRMRPHLARFVTRLLGSAGSRDHAAGEHASHADDPAVEFVPVPALQGDGDPHRHGESDSRRRGGGTATAPRIRAVKGGAGLETELADARRPDTVPADLRAALPLKGLVNYLEARAIIRDLEGLVADAAFRSEAARWQRGEGEQPVRGPAVAVIALYPSQAELIRLLAARVPALEACPLVIEIGTPEQFRQRECLTALVSMTRSHPHRPVSFGEGPQALALALTRARARLILFGDPGTLVRRCQCGDPVDHLDSSTASRERALVAHLVSFIQGHGERPAIFRLRQGTAS